MPYKADAVTEITQSLADGNRIVRKTTSAVSRDSEGRTRREANLARSALSPPTTPRGSCSSRSGGGHLVRARARQPHRPQAVVARSGGKGGLRGGPAADGDQGPRVRFAAGPMRWAREMGSPDGEPGHPDRRAWRRRAPHDGDDSRRSDRQREGDRDRFERWFSPELQAVLMSYASRSAIRRDHVPLTESRAPSRTSRSSRCRRLHRTRRPARHDAVPPGPGHEPRP